MRVVRMNETRRIKAFSRYDVPGDFLIAHRYGDSHGPNYCQIDLIVRAEQRAEIYHACYTRYANSVHFLPIVFPERQP